MERSVVDSFADWVHSSIFVPSVIVVATEQAQSSVKETNGITLAELFTPFGGHVANIPVNYSIAERGHFHNLAFKVSFLDLADVEPPAASKNATCSSQDYVLEDSRLPLPFREESLGEMEAGTHLYDDRRNAAAAFLHDLQTGATTSSSSSSSSKQGPPRKIQPAPNSMPPSPRASPSTSTPWFDHWRDAYLRSHVYRFQEHECVHQPFGTFFVVSSKEGMAGGTSSPAQVIIDLFEQILRLNTSPALCKRGVLEGNAPRLKILLHDAGDPESPSAAVLEQMLAQLKGTFNPATVCVLRINRVNSLLNAAGVGVGAAAGGAGAVAPDGGSGTSSRSGAGGVVPDNFGVAKIFEKFALKKGKYKYSNVANAAAGGTSKNDASSAPAAAVAAASGEQVGENYLRSLTMADCNEVQAIVKAFVKDMAVPWVERKLQMLDAQIASNRRGFQNTMKSLFRKPKEAGSGEFSAEGVGGGNGNSGGAGGNGGVKLAVYNLNTTEGQMRLAADFSFHLRDYEGAIGYYKSLISDFKQDRNWKHVGGCYEFQALCTFLNLLSTVPPPTLMSSNSNSALNGTSGANSGVVATNETPGTTSTATASVVPGVALVATSVDAAGLGQQPWEKLFHNAFEFYTKANKSNLAVRILLFLLKICDGIGCTAGSNNSYCTSAAAGPGGASDLPFDTGRFLKDTARLVYKCSNESLSQSTPSTPNAADNHNQKTGLLLEQAAELFGKARLFRKHAFHLVLAGHTYQKSGLKRLALRCYSVVIRYCYMSNWTHTTDHTVFTMARHCYGLGLFPEAIFHFHTLASKPVLLAPTLRGSPNANASSATAFLGTGARPTREQTYLKEFLSTLRVQAANLSDVGGTAATDTLAAAYRQGKRNCNVMVEDGRTAPPAGAAAEQRNESLSLRLPWIEAPVCENVFLYVDGDIPCTAANHARGSPGGGRGGYLGSSTRISFEFLATVLWQRYLERHAHAVKMGVVATAAGVGEGEAVAEAGADASSGTEGEDLADDDVDRDGDHAGTTTAGGDHDFQEARESLEVQDVDDITDADEEEKEGADSTTRGSFRRLSVNSSSQKELMCDAVVAEDDHDLIRSTKRSLLEEESAAISKSPSGGGTSASARAVGSKLLLGESTSSTTTKELENYIDPTGLQPAFKYR